MRAHTDTHTSSRSSVVMDVSALTFALSCGVRYKHIHTIQPCLFHTHLDLTLVGLGHRPGAVRSARQVSAAHGLNRQRTVKSEPR